MQRFSFLLSNWRATPVFRRLLTPGFRPAWALLVLIPLIFTPPGRAASLPAGGAKAITQPKSTERAYARHPVRDPIAVLVLVPDMGFRELALTRTPSLERLAKRGGAGMMNVRTVHSGSVDEAFLTIGAGARANASFVGEIGQSFGADERFEGARASDVYRRRTALDPQRFHLLALDYAQITADSAVESYDLRPGLLGDSLRQAGIWPAAIGNGDTPVGYPSQNILFHREVVGAAMDHLGRVAAGDVSEKLLKSDAGSPFSVHLDDARVLKEFVRLAPRYRYIAVEDGDLLALHGAAAVYTGAAYRRQQRAAVQRLDRLVGGFMASMDVRRDLLVVCAPAVEAAPGASPALTPIIAAGPAIRSDWLASAATRRAGLVVITDLTPTILAFFNVPIPPSISGSPVSSAPAGRRRGAGLLWDPGSRAAPLASISALEARVARADQQRDDVQRWFVYLIQAVVLFSAAAIGLPGWRPLARTGLAKWGLLVALAIPLAMFLEPFLQPGSSAVAALIVAAFTIGLVGVARSAGRIGLSAVSVLAWLSVAMITLDLLNGQQAMIFSMLSYSPTEGARYYGIGNEYMGVLLGAAVCAICSAAGEIRWRRALAAAALFIPALLICLPSIGAKAGGALVAVPTALVGAWLLLGGRLSWRTPLWLAAAGVVALAVIAVWDLHSGRSMSHIGRAAADIQAGGLQEMLNIVGRKALMEWRLMKYSPWSRCLLFTLAALVVIYFARGPAWRALPAERGARAAAWALGTASLTGLLFNDAGVIAAALSLVWLPALVAEKTDPRRCAAVAATPGAARGATSEVIPTDSSVGVSADIPGSAPASGRRD